MEVNKRDLNSCVQFNFAHAKNDNCPKIEEKNSQQRNIIKTSRAARDNSTAKSQTVKNEFFLSFLSWEQGRTMPRCQRDKNTLTVGEL